MNDDEPPEEYNKKEIEELEYKHLEIQDFDEVDENKRKYKPNWIKRLKSYALYLKSLMRERIH